MTVLSSVQRRVLGAVRFVDGVSGRPVTDGLRVQTPEGAVLRLGREGRFVIWQAPGLEAHTTAFEAAPAQPALGSMALAAQVTDGRGRYLPRQFVVDLPRDPDASRSREPDSLFQPHDVVLYAAPVAGLSAGIAALRVSTRIGVSQTPLGHVLLQVARNSDGALLGTGFSDARGEALVLLPTVPAVIASEDDGDGPVMTRRIEATLRAFYDPAGAALPIDPDRLIERTAVLPGVARTLSLTAGQTITLTLTISEEDE